MKSRKSSVLNADAIGRGVRNVAYGAVVFAAGVGSAIALSGCDKIKGLEDAVKSSARVEKNDESYFSKSELDTINYTADRVGVDPALLKAIRVSENGRGGLEFGIISTPRYENDKGVVEAGEFRSYKSEFEKQASWCAWTIKKSLQRYEDSGSKGDFIDFLQERYCPIGAENDPDGLNKNWEDNVKDFYGKFGGKGDFVSKNSKVLVYEALRGDTYYGISRKKNTTVDSLKRLNPGIVPTEIQIGQKIKYQSGERK